MKKNILVKIIIIVAAAVILGAAAAFAFVGVAKTTGAIDKYKEIIENIKSGEDFSASIGNSSLNAKLDIYRGENDNRTAGTEETEKEEMAPVKLNIGSTATSTVYNSVADIAEDVMPALVAISMKTIVTYDAGIGGGWFFPMPSMPQQYETSGSGSGIIIGENDTEYIIVTNNHVVEDATEIKVQFIDDTSVSAALKGRDSSTDVAVISVKKDDLGAETKAAIKIATLGDSDKLRVGEGVVAIGNALGYGQSVTVGYVSALNRTFQVEATGPVYTVIQTDAAINPGNSGGALVNMSGEVIGINHGKLSSSAVEGIGYAIPISNVTDLIESLSNLETRQKIADEEKGYLGIQGLSIDAEVAEVYGMPEGAFVNNIVEGTGAANSDLKTRDIITKINKQTVNDMAELREFLDTYRIGETVELTVQRLIDGEYKELIIPVTLTPAPVVEE